ncbi:hypothetical protein [Allorhodopirellula solitaria]|uniref:Uncharacterized protein n=1 Tax=Allorhodopirellula solitaria TaxID=2527987 RepID=A0A5C5YKG2_9BACT|nr:hypothetical protein [Allorhodopirellula solitaria]TWT75268.1 hypothetical protein CA85_05570 [Allorhodopirellula solitaria]
MKGRYRAGGEDHAGVRSETSNTHAAAAIQLHETMQQFCAIAISINLGEQLIRPHQHPRPVTTRGDTASQDSAE